MHLAKPHVWHACGGAFMFLHESTHSVAHLVQPQSSTAFAIGAELGHSFDGSPPIIVM